MKTNKAIQPRTMAMCAAAAVFLGLLVDKVFFLVALGVGAIAVTDAAVHATRGHSGRHPRTAP